MNSNSCFYLKEVTRQWLMLQRVDYRLAVLFLPGICWAWGWEVSLASFGAPTMLHKKGGKSMDQFMSLTMFDDKVLMWHKRSTNSLRQEKWLRLQACLSLYMHHSQQAIHSWTALGSPVCLLRVYLEGSRCLEPIGCTHNCLLPFHRWNT